MSTDNIPLLSPVELGPYKLVNRIVMAPLTRKRAGQGNIPTPINAIYYAQRASAGLIIAEASQISPQGAGSLNTPGIYSKEQVAGWRLVTDAVHERGGRIFLQLWHAGRMSHPSMQPGGQLPIAPSPIAVNGQANTYLGPQPFVTPRALETEEIPEIIEQYRMAAKNALAAGFDGIELHSANGHLLDQFLQDGSNQRTDKYGGSIENRARFLLEVTEAVISVWGANRVGIRLSPGSNSYSMHDSNPKALFRYVACTLNSFDLAYLHIVEPRMPTFTINANPVDLGVAYFRPIFKGTLITAGGYNREMANAVISRGDASLVAFGRLFIANPDLPKRFALDAPLNEPDRSTFYTKDEKGYVDYPSLEELSC